MKRQQRAGRVLSAANENRLRDALSAMGAALSSIEEILNQLGGDDRGLRFGASGVEERCVAMGGVEVREAEGGEPVIRGHAAVFNRLSVFLWGFREQIAPGAFVDSLGADVRALWQHDSARVLGRTAAGTLKLWEDNEGLGFEVTPPDTQDGRDAVTLIGRGDVDQMSFGFTVPIGGEEWSEDEAGIPIRTLKRVNLIEISPVTFPAYPDTEVGIGMRNAPEWVVRRALQAQGVSDREMSDDQARARLDDLLRKRINLLGLGLHLGKEE